jgi:hypothetical protein
MSRNALVLTDTAAAAVVADVVRFGGSRVETGGFLLAPRHGDARHIVALAGTAGIVRRRDLFQVSDLALDRLFAYADEQHLSIPAQFHSHRLEAFMSDCDIAHGLSVDGFLTTIIPRFADPPNDPARWGWWRYEGRWAAIPPPHVVPGAVNVIRFDEEGIRAA